MNTENIFDKAIKSLRKHLQSLSEAEKEALRERLIDKRPKGWLNIEEHLPHMYIKDMKQGYSIFKVRDKSGNEFNSHVTDHNIWYDHAKDLGITHWLNE